MSRNDSNQSSLSNKKMHADFIDQETQKELFSNLKITARSAICVRLSEQMDREPIIVFEEDADRKVSPASITKLLTAVTASIIADRLEIPTSYQLSATSNDMVKGSGFNLLDGDRLSFKDGMADLLLVSSNSAANLIARTFGQLVLESEGGIGGDFVGRFVTEMNAVAQNFGMKHSQFTNPDGLAQRGHHSTARDLARLVEECICYPQITEFWGLGEYSIAIAGPRARTLALKSSLMERYINNAEISGFKGGKTGTLWPSNFSLAANSISHNGDQLISVILGSTTDENRYIDYRTIVEIGNTAY